MDRGIIVDVETTGLDCNKDSIIEIGICEFGWVAGEQPVLLSMYGGLQDPKVPLDPEIIKLTGLSDRCLQGQIIDWRIVQELWQRSSIVVAHNAGFDRDFLTKRSELSDFPKHWACSVRHIDWEIKGYGSRKLQYLAADHGFLNAFAHRAIFDCATTFRLIAPHIQELVSRSYEPEVKLIAVGSPFETKDILKERKYRWDGDLRAWHKTVASSSADQERQFLAAQVYGGKSRHVEEIIWFNTP